MGRHNQVMEEPDPSESFAEGISNPYQIAFDYTDHRLERLWLKVQQYGMRQIQYTYHEDMTPEERVAVEQASYCNWVKTVVLETVAVLAQNRNARIQPVGIHEVAQMYTQRTGVDISSAEHAPVRYSSEYNWHVFETDTLPIESRAFLGAWEVVRAYAMGRTDVLKGQGLPDFHRGDYSTQPGL